MAIDDERCAELIERCLAYSKADEMRVSVSEESTSHLRFARNTSTTSAVIENLSVQVRSSFGARSASVAGNRTDADSLRDLVRQAERSAELMPEDEEAVPELGRSGIRRAPAPLVEDDATRLGAMAAGAAHCIQEAKAASLIAAGFIQVQSGVRALGTSAGLYASHAFSQAHFSTTVRTPDGSGSGWSSCAAAHASALDFKESSRVARSKARGSAKPTPFEAGSMPTILEPACVASLLGILMDGMQARSLDEGRSAFAIEEVEQQGGPRFFPSLINVHSDPFDELVPAQPWDPEGLPHAYRDWIKAGRLGAFTCGRYWAEKSKRKPLPSAPNAIMLGGPKSLQELIQGTERALLVTNLWYMRQVDARSMLYTGLTRDGVFLVENGEVQRPLNNFRWNDSPIRIFKAAEELSRSVRLGGRGGQAQRFLVPAMKVADFQFSSISEAV